MISVVSIIFQWYLWKFRSIYYLRYVFGKFWQTTLGCNFKICSHLVWSRYRSHCDMIALICMIWTCMGVYMWNVPCTDFSRFSLKQMLMFCEGTRFTPEKYEKSKAFALKKGLPVLKHHLTPRTKGFCVAVEGLKGRGRWTWYLFLHLMFFITDRS